MANVLFTRMINQKDEAGILVLVADALRESAKQAINELLANDLSAVNAKVEITTADEDGPKLILNLTLSLEVTNVGS